jgi:hypothetical protein
LAHLNPEGGSVKLSPQEVETRDRELVIRSNDGLRNLMQFRYEQTVGAVDGYSMNAYAKIVGCHKKTIQRSVNGYALLLKWEGGALPARHSPLDAYNLGGESESEQTAIIAVADVTNKTPAAVRHGGPRGGATPEVKAAKKAARAAVDEAIEQGADEDAQREAAEQAAQKAVREHKRTEAKREQEILEQVPEMRPDPYEPIDDLAKITEILRFGVITGLKNNVDKLALSQHVVDMALRQIHQARTFLDAIEGSLESGREMDDALAALLNEEA